MTGALCALFLLGGTWLPGDALPVAASAAIVAPAKVDPATTAQRRRRRRRGQQRPTAERIREIQQALIRAGYLEGKPTGRWDAKTRAAMRRLQEENGLPVTGKLDARSLVKLGLGSETAGVAAPHPLPPEPVQTDEKPDDKPGNNRQP
ncbi:MAG: peptidoglycan-binding protein [Acidobacteria bacterium]|nr:peptidoglycan-binding protein [Acidobacteriota bacterium]